MKTTFTLVILLVANTFIAQTDPLPIPQNAIWQMGWQSMLNSDHGTYAYRINGTETVNDTVYFKVEQFNYCDSSIPVSTLMLIREQAGRWYHRYNETENERLLFDFTLEVGDNISIQSCFDFFEEPQNLIVTAIEELTMYDGSVRNMWTLVYDETSPIAGNYEYWIEGMGNLYIGLVHSLSFTCVDLNEWLHCYFEDEDRKFPSYEFPEGVDCCINVGVPEISLSTSLALYPNPVVDYIHLPAELVFREGYILDGLGNSIPIDIQDMTRKQVDVSTLSSGVYWIELVDAAGRKHGGRFVRG